MNKPLVGLKRPKSFQRTKQVTRQDISVLYLYLLQDFSLVFVFFLQSFNVLNYERRNPKTFPRGC